MLIAGLARESIRVFGVLRERRFRNDYSTTFDNKQSFCFNQDSPNPLGQHPERALFPA
jgi:hypothetical protein